MSDNGNKKAPGALADGELSDEVLEAVAGGDLKDKLKAKNKQLFACNNCHDPEKATRTYVAKHDCVYGPVLYCDDCARLFGLL